MLEMHTSNIFHDLGTRYDVHIIELLSSLAVVVLHRGNL